MGADPPSERGRELRAPALADVRGSGPVQNFSTPSLETSVASIETTSTAGSIVTA